MEQGSFQAAGHTIAYRSFPVPNEKGRVIGIHGYSEYSHCYSEFAEFWNKKGWSFYICDLPGHGLSTGARSDIERFEIYTDVMEVFVEKNIGRGRNVLFGHSLGGLVAIRFAQTSKQFSRFEKLLLSSPLLGLATQIFFGVGKLLQTENGLRILESILKFCPNYVFKNTGDLGGSVLTHDKEKHAERVADPVITPVIVVRWVRQFLKARRLAFADVKKITKPVGIFAAGDDYVVSPFWSEEFFKRLDCKKTWKIYPKLFHEILNEVERDSVMEEMYYFVDGST